MNRLASFSTPAHALHLLGAKPVLVLAGEPWHLCVQLRRDGDAFVGVVPQQALLTDRLRLDGTIRFFAQDDSGRSLAGDGSAQIIDVPGQPSTLRLMVRSVGVDGSAAEHGTTLRT
jgi:hypothetical protein